LDVPSKGRLSCVCRELLSFLTDNAVWECEILRRWRMDEAERSNSALFRASPCAKDRFRELELQSRPFRQRAEEVLSQLGRLRSSSTEWTDFPIEQVPELDAAHGVRTSYTIQYGAAKYPSVLGIRVSVELNAPAEVVADTLLNLGTYHMWHKGVMSSRCMKYIEDGMEVACLGSPCGLLVVFRASAWRAGSFMLGMASRFPAGLVGPDGVAVPPGGMQDIPCPFARMRAMAGFAPSEKWEMLPCGFIVTPNPELPTCVVTMFAMLDTKARVPSCLVHRLCGVKTAVVHRLRTFIEQHELQRLQRQQLQDDHTPPDPCSVTGLISWIRRKFAFRRCFFNYS